MVRTAHWVNGKLVKGPAKKKMKKTHSEDGEQEPKEAKTKSKAELDDAQDDSKKSKKTSSEDGVQEPKEPKAEKTISKRELEDEQDGSNSMESSEKKAKKAEKAPKPRGKNPACGCKKTGDSYHDLNVKLQQKTATELLSMVKEKGFFLGCGETKSELVELILKCEDSCKCLDPRDYGSALKPPLWKFPDDPGKWISETLPDIPQAPTLKFHSSIPLESEGRVDAKELFCEWFKKKKNASSEKRKISTILKRIEKQFEFFGWAIFCIQELINRQNQRGAIYDWPDVEEPWKGVRSECGEYLVPRSGLLTFYNQSDAPLFDTKIIGARNRWEKYLREFVEVADAALQGKGLPYDYENDMFPESPSVTAVALITAFSECAWTEPGLNLVLDCEDSSFPFRFWNWEDSEEWSAEENEGDEDEENEEDEEFVPGSVVVVYIYDGRANHAGGTATVAGPECSHLITMTDYL
eukprot:g30555.t1